MLNVDAKYDECHAAIVSLHQYYADHLTDRNEATTRLHLINRLIFDCLGWEHRDVVAEEHQRKERDEYTDYTFYAPRKVMIWEAKRQSDYFEIPVGNTGQAYKIKGLCKDNPALKAAVQQAMGYCQDRGTPVGVVTNGHQIVAFIGTRSDGVAPIDGRAIVFPNLAYMANHFIELWNCLSKTAIENKLIFERLAGSTHPEVPRKLSADLGNEYPGTKNRNLFQTDLKVVADVVLEDIIGSQDLEEEFLKHCYCRSGLLSRHSLASKSILQARYAALFDKRDPGPITVPAVTTKGVSEELIAKSFSRRPILLIGDVGVGKTIFIRQLMKLDSPLSSQNSIAIYLDLGHEAMLAPDLKKHIATDVANKLKSEYSIDIYANNFVRGIYRDDIDWLGTKSIYAPIKSSNPDKFLDRELALLESKISNQEEHLRISIEHIVNGQRKQFVLFIDNTDQRGFATQDEAFLIAQGLANKWPAVVYIPLRPETFHRSKSAGALAAYHEKAFTIEPPRVEEVIDKRLSFALEVLDGRVELPFLTDDMVIKQPQLKSIIKSLQESINNREDLQECLDNMSGSNIRAALGFVRTFCGSGHVDAAKIVEKYNSLQGYSIPLHEFLRAMIYGDTSHYDPSSATPVANIFDISGSDGREHFTLPIVLGLLHKGQQDGRSKDGFVPASTLYELAHGFGYTADQIDFGIIRAYRKKLIETSARQPVEDTKQVQMPRSFRITTIGIYHATRLPTMFTYTDAMVVDTPIVDYDARKKMIDVERITDRIERGRHFANYLDTQWSKVAPGAQAVFDWPSLSQALKINIDDVAKRANQVRRRSHN